MKKGTQEQDFIKIFEKELREIFWTDEELQDVLRTLDSILLTYFELNDSIADVSPLVKFRNVMTESFLKQSNIFQSNLEILENEVNTHLLNKVSRQT